MTDNNNEINGADVGDHAAGYVLPFPNTPAGNDKQRLLRLIVEQGILHDSEQHPIIARDGQTRLSWVMNFLAISLNAEHLQLAARQMLQLLAAFEGCQLATIGTAAVPLLSACILESGGKYNGLMVRAKRKAYGTASLIDGRINHAEPVIVIDDSIGSGTNMLECIEKLEEVGLYVEGCACLVRFGYDSGYTKLVERGYRVLALFDNTRDISPWHSSDWQYDPYPLKSSFRHIVWDEQQLPDFISPFRAIRQSIQHFWQTGKLLKPPQRFNQTLDTSGGVWLSLRAQDVTHTSQGRHGFWHFPEDDDGASTLDISRVAWLFGRYLQNDPQREQRLQQCALALSLFGRLEVCPPGGFDQRQHGLVLRSTESPWKMGGALPNMPGISSDAHLLHHARFHNTGLFAHEPCLLYRHSVKKLVEPGAEWPYGGSGDASYRWDENMEVVEPLARTVSDYVQNWHQHGVLPDTVNSHYIPPRCQWLFLSVYHQGRQLACVGTAPQHSAGLLQLVEAATKDQRWQLARQREGAGDENDLYLRLSLLSEESNLGASPGLDTLQNFVLGQDAIAIQHEQQFALILPEVPLEQQWNVTQLSDALFQKSGVNQQGQSVQWLRYRTVTWHIDRQECQQLNKTTNLPVPQAEASHDELISACRYFLQQHRQTNGAINSHYHPFLHCAYQQDSLLNTAHIMFLLGGVDNRADEWHASYDFIAQAVSDEPDSSTECAYCVLALMNDPVRIENHRSLIARQLDVLQSCFNRHGQLPRAEQVNDHYSIELYALLQARQQGFHVDPHLLQKAVKHVLKYADFDATPRQFPALLQTIVLAGDLESTGIVDFQGLYISEMIEQLTQGLLQWQQTTGGFIPETPDMPPVILSLRAMNALLDADELMGESLTKSLQYLKTYIIQPAHQEYVSVPEYTVGGVYNGLYDGCLPVVASAQLLKLLQRLKQQEGDRG
ncbi:MAG: AMMECR1 domain-containing protein [Thiolinea sp.]